MKRAALALLLVVATAAGLAGGLYYTWVLDPVEYYDSAPDALDVADKLVYLTLIGDLYAGDGDLAQAEARLADLGVAADGQALAGFIEQYLDGGGQLEQVRNLARLAKDLGARGGALLVFDGASTPQPTATDPAQAEAPPTIQSTVFVPEAAFRLVEQTAICAEAGQAGRIAVRVQDAAGAGIPGTEVVVSWPQGQDRFFTGLRPERGAGYADFQMQPTTEYDVALAGSDGDVAQGLSADLSPGVCPSTTLALNWQLTFEKMP